MQNAAPSALTLLRIALAAFVLAWIFGPTELRSAVPVWVAFVIALALEVQFFLGGLRRTARRRPDARPQEIDLERYGYQQSEGELLLVRRDGEELWVPYAGETDEELEELIAQTRELEREREPEPPFYVAEGRNGRSFLTGLAVVAGLAVVLWLVERNTGWDSLDGETRAAAVERFSTEASRIAGKPVSIRCDEAGRYVGAVQHADGIAIVGGRLAYLTPDVCRDLYELAFDGEISGARTGRALAVMAHEAWHLRGVRAEGTTECYALQSGVELGRRLGLSENTARRLMRQQLTENALRRGASLEYRVPAECRDGGSLDLTPAAGDFP